MVNGMTVYAAIGPEWFDGEVEDRTIDRDYWRGVVGKVVTMPLSQKGKTNMLKVHLVG